MKLYDTRMAPNPRRVRWVMAEKGIEDIEIVPVDLMTGGHRSPEHRARAGTSHVPVLELEDGTCLSESLAIARYLEAIRPEPNLFGHDAREQALVEMWTRRAEIYLANPIMLHTRFSHPALAALEAPVPEVAAYNLTLAEKFMKLMDRHLAGHEFLALDRFTIADIVAFIGIDFARLVKYRPPAEHEHLKRWLDACRARPAARF